MGRAVAGVVAHQDGVFLQSIEGTFSHGVLSAQVRCEHLSANPSAAVPTMSKIIRRSD